MKLTRTRTVSQLFFLGLFLFLLGMAESSRIGSWPVPLFLRLDPLSAVVTALSSRTLYHGLILALFVLIPTVFLGRFFCGWVCPMGTVNHFFSRLFRSGDRKACMAANRYRRFFALKYYFLTVMILLALFGVAQTGLLDPISLLTRSLSTSVAPAAGEATHGWLFAGRVFEYAWLTGAILIAILLANALVPRLFCRAVCPLGALLGVFSRFIVFQVWRSEKLCIHCSRCTGNCQGASDPHLRLRKSECFVCMECREVCPTDAISFRALSAERDTVPYPDVSRRRILQAGVVALIGVPLLRVSAGPKRLPAPGVIRPPGAEPEEEFLARCVKCGECMKVCPTNAIQPALHEAGIEGIYTPVLVNRIGYCEYNCSLCGSVCPTGAIRDFSLDEKLGRGKYEEPIKLGLAFVDRGRCLPWAMNTPCIVCEEMCPVSPKAIYLETAEVTGSSGAKVIVQRPVVDPARCIGCGICENKCPVHDLRAIRVTSVGESRSDRNVLLLRGRQAGL